jgi:hypothetical protein
MSLPRFRRHLSPLRSFSASLALIALTGCESDERSPRRGLPAAATGATIPLPATPEMSVHRTFFAGQLETEILLGHAGFGPRANGKDSAPPAGGEARGRGGFSGSMGGGGGGRRRGGGEPGDARSGQPPARTSDGAPAPHIVAANRPPMRLHLRLTNHGTEPVDVEVLDFNSDLGNFVVQPRKISLPPGASVEADPMTSRIGLTADAIPVTVRVRRNGQVEQQVLMLQPVAPPVPAPNPPPGTP